MPSEFNPTPPCQHCNYDTHHCFGCGAALTHADCDGAYKGICDDCQPLMQARP